MQKKRERINPTIKYIRNTFIGYYNPDANTIYLNKRLKKAGV